MINSILSLVKPCTIWKLKYGRVVMVIGHSQMDENIVNVIREATNERDIEYLSSFLEATLIG